MNRLQRIETFVRKTMDAVVNPDLRIGHDIKHVEWVRRNALTIARDEGFADLDRVEAAALLHDIGLASVETRDQHGPVGAEMAARFLREQHLFSEDEIAAIAKAIHNHSLIHGDWDALGYILRDADSLDTLGAVGLMRAFTSKYFKPEYDPEHIKGETWGLSADGFTARHDAGLGIGSTIMDQINLQISLIDELHTATARRMAEPRVAFMKAFVVELEAEIINRK
ncbi:MAG TPA: HD domain-containing protein [Anaerolineae bacterium]|mgnify:CR=1 FL=1|nr:HD domain-containing protein [Anaerolineae bacterium]HQI84863.1 HD domain-containing protein [Anaerolineae bacterium]